MRTVEPAITVHETVDHEELLVHTDVARLMPRHVDVRPWLPMSWTRMRRATGALL